MTLPGISIMAIEPVKEKTMYWKSIDVNF